MPGAAERLAFGLLGPLQASRDGSLLPLGGRQQRAVLAVLVAEVDSVISLARIADALWGEHLPSGYAATVQTYVFHLREVLEPDRRRGAPAQVLVTEPSGYRLHAAEDTVDAARFEEQVRAGQALLKQGKHGEAAATLAAALALWRGDVLADLADFAFVAPLASRLDQVRRSALQARIEAELALGKHSALLGELDDLAARYPLDEELHAARILALYRSGRQVDALDAYRGVRTVLRNELGVDPGPRLQQLHHDVLAHDPRLDWQASPAAAGDGHRASGAPATGSRAEHPGRGRRRVRRRRWIVGGSLAAAVLAAGSIAGVVATHSPHSSLPRLPANSVGAVHADGSLHDAVPVGQNPDGITYGAGYLWAVNTSDNTVSQIDPRSHGVVQQYQVGAQPAAVTISGDNAWVVNSADGTVTRINIPGRRAVGDPIKVGTQPAAIASGPSGVWVANSADGRIQRIDPDTGQVSPPIEVGSDPDGLAVDASSVWVANGANGAVSRIDPATGDDLGSTPVDAGPKGITLSAGSAWVANQGSQNVTRIDAGTGNVLATIPVGQGPDSIAAAGKYIWVSDEYDGTIAKIDPRTNRAVAKFALGASPRGLISIGSTVWVTSGAFANRAHLGGTLTIVSQAPVFTIDPAGAYLAVPIERMLYDGLVTYRKVGGVAGQTLVPDLATRVPQPTDGGKTYTFTLRRPPIRYSDGRPVHASDIRRGVLRALGATEGNPGYFSGIVGAAACIPPGPLKPQPRCDLSRGIAVNDAAGRITFHLTAPDPDFLHKLTIFAVATAPGNWPRLSQTKRLPATGPYMIKTYEAAKLLVLDRNPYFHQWSIAAQPPGYPEHITWRTTADAHAQITAVITGHADATYGLTGATNATRQQITTLGAELQTQYPTLFHTELGWITGGDGMNERIPPFNDIRVRRALNYAVDRRTLADLNGEGPQAGVSCQVLPPRFPGYQPYCPYTTPPLDGSYHGPDLAKAKQLIAASPYKGMAVTAWNLDDPTWNAVGAYLVTVLKQLGFRANQQVLPNTPPNYLKVFGPPARTQFACCLGWGSDFPTPGNFFASAWLGCPANGNPFGYCNPDVDALVKQAQTADPVTANRLWAQIDRKVTDDAPWISEYVGRTFVLTSKQVGNYQSNLLSGPLWDQMWVK